MATFTIDLLSGKEYLFNGDFISGTTGASGVTPTLIFTGNSVVNYTRIGTTYTINVSGATGATLQQVTTIGASTTIESTFSGGLVIDKIRPTGDTITAVQITKADGTPIINVDTVSDFTGFGTEIPTSTLHNAGSLTVFYRAIQALRTLDATDYVVDCTGNTFTVTLPTAIGITGRIYNIKNTGTGIITVDCDGIETIDDELTQVISQWENIVIISTGINWIIL